jgi:NADH-quinone oxidoreductase subunit L
MRVAMGILALGAVTVGLVQIPKVDFLVDDFLRPAFAGPHAEPQASSDLLAVSVAIGTLLGLAGIAIAFRIWVQRPGLATAARERLHGAYQLFVNKWYFDELIERLIERPAAACGRYLRDGFERRVVEETLVGGTTALVRAGSAAVRAAQSGFVRYYAALLVLGVAAVGFYFLLQS